MAGGMRVFPCHLLIICMDPPPTPQTHTHLNGAGACYWPCGDWVIQDIHTHKRMLVCVGLTTTASDSKGRTHLFFVYLFKSILKHLKQRMSIFIHTGLVFICKKYYLAWMCIHFIPSENAANCVLQWFLYNVAAFKICLNKPQDRHDHWMKKQAHSLLQTQGLPES